MPDWLHDSFPQDADLPVSLLVVRLSVALALGCAVAGVYRLTRRPTSADAANLVPTLVLLTVIIAMVTLAIGNSVARAFSLVGALAIVRFRTVVEDTRDTAFVIFAVAVGLAAGAGFLTVPLVGIPVAALAALLFRPRAENPLERPLDFTLRVRVGVGHLPDALLREAFGKHLKRVRLLATATARQGVALDLTYGVRLRHEDAAVTLVTELNGLEGVQEVELRPA
ncbi:MAG: DUF4956 domain-containing protein [Gemmataceae bacterium]|nr:DUF4956 domain-containing protein [Gemmataceae bacterium]